MGEIREREADDRREARWKRRFRGETSGPGRERCTDPALGLGSAPVRRCVFNYSIIHPAIHHQPSVKFILFLCIGPLQLATMYQLLISHDLFGARGIPPFLCPLLRRPIFVRAR